MSRGKEEEVDGKVFLNFFYVADFIIQIVHNSPPFKNIKKSVFSSFKSGSSITTSWKWLYMI